MEWIRSTWRSNMLGGAAVALLLAPAPAAAQDLDLGLRGGFYTDGTDAFVGGELLGRFPRSRWYWNPNLEFVFVDDGDLITANADFHYDFPVEAPFALWLGGGPALIFRDFDGRPRGRGRGGDDETDLGLNLLAGLGFNRRGILRPYLQGKITLADDSEASLALGVRF